MRLKTGRSDVQKMKSQQNTDKMTYSHLFSYSKLRGNMIRWYPVEAGQRVLLVSEPCIALEEALHELGAVVEVQSLGERYVGTQYKAATAHAISDNSVDAVSGSTSAKYDIILQVGVFDVGEKNIQTAWKERLTWYRSLLKEKGTLLLAVPNRFGLKYFAGCQDDFYDVYFAGPEGYAPKMTRPALGKKEYETLLKESGFSEIESYYPYPDYRFPSVIYSDERLPEPGELTDNICNFDKDRYVLFDEAKVFGGLVKEGMFPAFANSFLFACCMGEVRSVDYANALEGKPEKQIKQPKQQDREHTIYSKFSMERDEKFQIRTDIVQIEETDDKASDGDCKSQRYTADSNVQESVGKRVGKEMVRVVRKYPLTRAAEQHVNRMASNYEKLKRQAEGTIVRFCPIKMLDGAAEFPWRKGEALQHKLHKLLERGEEEAAEQLILQYIQVITALPATEAVDVDLIFPNILVEGDVWNVIDYEWTFEPTEEMPIPTKWVIYRALFYLSIELSGYELTKLPGLLKLAEIDSGEAEKFAAWENCFQAYLKGDTLPIGNMVDLLGNRVIPFQGKENPKDREVKRRMNLAEKNVKKIFYYVEQAEKKDGKAILAGWACAKTKTGEYIPVHISVFDEEGNPIGRAVERVERTDVAAVLKAETDFPYWGFSVLWSVAPDQTFTLRLNAGKCQQEMTLFE